MLFDLATDPNETTNLANEPTRKAEVADLLQTLHARIAIAETFETRTPLRILPLGDSITRGRNGDSEIFTGGYRRPLEKILDAAVQPAEWTFVGEVTTDSPEMRSPGHQGLGGIDTRGVLSGNFRNMKNSPLNLLLQIQKPDIVLLNLGTNDLSQRDAPTVFADYEKVRNLVLKTRPGSFIIGNTLLGRHGKPGLDKRFDEFNELLKSRQAEWEAAGNYRLVDLAVLSDTSTPDDLPDGVHPAQALYDDIAKALAAAVVPEVQKLISERDPEKTLK